MYYFKDIKELYKLLNIDIEWPAEWFKVNKLSPKQKYPEH